VLKIIKPQETG